MIAYLILIHRYPVQFRRLFEAIYHPDNFYVIHVDKRADSELHDYVQELISNYSNVQVLESEMAIWGGYSLVDAELRGIEKLLEMGADWKFFINLSGQDFPLKSQSQITEFLLNNEGVDFLKCNDQLKMRPDTMHRVENFVEEVDGEIVSIPLVKRDFMEGVTPYIGNQWMILTRTFCEFISQSPEVEPFKQFYKNTLISDEGFFQTVIMNTSYESRLINDDLRSIDWIPMGTIKLRPRDYTIQDSYTLRTSKNLFARKFDENVDHEILNDLEMHIAV